MSCEFATAPSRDLLSCIGRGAVCARRRMPGGCAALCLILMSTGATLAQAPPSLPERIEGLLIGSLIGDAAGGPFEFRPPDRSAWTRTDRVLTEAGIDELASRFALHEYVREAEPYGPWTRNAPAGTVTDDSRFKILFFNSLEAAGGPSRRSFARSILDFHADTAGVHGQLPRQWLDEFAGPARWILGMSEDEGALPPERSWGGIPTMAGQMPFLPVAGLAPGDPERAYRIVWDMDFLDNGTAFDLNAGLVAGLSAALEPGADWNTVERAMRTTDPFRYGEVPWVGRPLSRWLDFSHSSVERSGGRAATLFEILEEELGATTWWEGHVPMTVVFACAELARYDPLAAMQLILEFGHDTDSYLQVAGAFVGALHGKEIFPEYMREAVHARLEADYGDSPDRWLHLMGVKTDPSR